MMLSDFMAFYFSDAWQAIDWERPHRFLDQELQKIVPESDTGRRVVDSSAHRDPKQPRIRLRRAHDDLPLPHLRPLPPAGG